MTLRLAVYGDPVDHSLSPIIQRAALQHAAIRGTYGRRRVSREGMESAVQHIRQGLLDGANVTMPLKDLAAGYADELEGAAVRLRVANTLWRRDGKVIGTSTDPEGVRFAWEHASLPEQGAVLVLGSGAAAAAAVETLHDREIVLSARNQAAAEAIATRSDGQVQVAPWPTVVEGAVVVNATPLGMRGESLPDEVLDGAAGLLEMTYGSAPSPAAVAMRADGKPVAEGELMLVGQGAASFSIWTGVSVPPSVMLAAVDRYRHAQRPDQ